MSLIGNLISAMRPLQPGLRVLGGAAFFAPLTAGLALSRGTGSQTITRATTHTVQNNDGFLVTCLSGEIPIKGGRRIYNLIPAAGTGAASLAVAANKSMTLAAGTYVFSMGAGTGTATFSGTGGATGTLDASASGRVSVSKTITAGTLVVTASVATLVDLQVESVDAQTTKTAGEYVSVGNPSDWAGTTLVSNGTFDSGTTGWASAPALTSTAAVVSGEFQVTATSAFGRQLTAITTVIGLRYVVTAMVRRVSGTGGIYISHTSSTGADIVSATNTTSSTAVRQTLEFTATSTTSYISCATLTSGDVGGYDDVICKPAIYHGAGVDGVKWFTTDISGNPIAAATLAGVEVWPAATTLCLQSNAFTTTWAASGTPAATQNVVGPDGATSAWTLTDNNAGATELVAQSISLTAATYTTSVFVKKTVGAQASYPVIYYYEGVGGFAASITVDTTNGIATAWTAYTGLSIPSGMVARCESHDETFWRVQMSFTGNTNSWSLALAQAGTTNATQSTGVIDTAAQGSAGFYGVQVELGSHATPYIATTTAAVTRNASVISVPTASNIASAAGFIALEYTPQHAPSGAVYLWGTYVDANNGTAILHDATNLIFRKRIAGVNYDATIANAFVSGTTYKMAASWGSAGTSIALNGTLGTPHANTTAAQIGTTMQTGADGNGASQPGMAIKNVYIGQVEPLPTELQAITQ